MSETTWRQRQRFPLIAVGTCVATWLLAVLLIVAAVGTLSAHSRAEAALTEATELKERSQAALDEALKELETAHAEKALADEELGEMK